LRSRLWLWVAGFAALAASGCGGGSSSTSSTASLRVFQGSPDAPLVNLLVDGKTVASNIAYGGNSGYISVTSGSRHVQVEPASGSTAIVDQTINLAASAKQTIVITGPVASHTVTTLTDGGTTATTGDGYLRIFNASSGADPSDAYIVISGTTLAGVTPVTANLAFNKDTGYKLLAAGNYDVYLTAPGTNNVYLNTGPLNVDASTNQTVFALDNLSGGFTYARLTD